VKIEDNERYQVIVRKYRGRNDVKRGSESKVVGSRGAKKICNIMRKEKVKRNVIKFKKAS
jgi:hypothetical protein